jgi:hypothetical protein
MEDWILLQEERGYGNAKEPKKFHADEFIKEHLR